MLLRLISVSRCIASLIEIPVNVPAAQNLGNDLTLVGQIRACGQDSLEDYFFSVTEYRGWGKNGTLTKRVRDAGSHDTDGCDAFD